MGRDFTPDELVSDIIKKQGPPFDDSETTFDNLVNEMCQSYKLFLIHQTFLKNRAKINCRHLNVTAVPVVFMFNRL